MDDLEARLERIERARRRAIRLLLVCMLLSMATTVLFVWSWSAGRKPSAASSDLATAPSAMAAPSGAVPAAPPPTAPTPANKVASTAAGATATLDGVVRFAGAPPRRAPLPMQADPFCSRHAADDEAVLVNANGTLKNVVVRVLGAPQAAPPAEPVVVEQRGCQYVPRIATAVVGQEVRIGTRDPTLHNVHAYLASRTVWNVAQVPNTPDIVKVLNEPGAFRLRCDVHQWMRGYVWVHDSSFIAISDDQGAFRIAGLPPGRYTVEAWHELYGTQQRELVAQAGASARADFEFRQP
jgi:plastocyanin